MNNFTEQLENAVPSLHIKRTIEQQATELIHSPANVAKLITSYNTQVEIDCLANLTKEATALCLQ